MRTLALVFSLVGSVALAGCYHATVDTGRTPSGQVVEKDWAHGFVYGLVPPSVVETTSRCPNGVAKVETQLSFLNQLASFLTGGIYTPMEITVQCASPNVATDAPELVAGSSLAEVLDRAAAEAMRTGKVVYVRF